MKFSKLSLAELLGVIAAAGLVLSLIFLTWFELAQNPARRDGEGFICGLDQYSCTGFETFPILRWLLIAGAVAPPILAYIVVRGHKLSWAPGEMTMVIGFTAFVLLLYNGVIDTPGDGTAAIGVSAQVGFFVALASAAGIAFSGVLRSMESQKGAARKAPGTV